MRSGGGGGVGGVESLGSSPCPTLWQKQLECGGKAGNGSGEFLPSLFSGGRPHFLAESGVGLLPGMVTSHIGHLVPQLCIFCLSFFLLFILLL